MIAAVPAVCRMSLFALQLLAVETGGREIAFSYDDSPRPDTAIMNADARTNALIAGLAEAGIEGSAFFVVTDRIDADGARRLRHYAAAGHFLANHTASHANLHTVGSEAFLDQVRAADVILKEFDGFRPWLRFPYLNHGADIAQRDAVRYGLADMGYSIGYVTIDNFDFYLDGLANDAVAAGLGIDWDGLRDLYVTMLADAADHYDRIARRHLGRSPRHVLLLHENDLAAMFSDDLARELRARGWTIISAERAYSDSIAEAEPETLSLGQGRVAALAHAAGAPEEGLRSPMESAEWLRTTFAALVTEQR